MMQDRALLEPPSLSGDTFNVILAVLDALGPDAPKSADAALRSISSLPVAGAGARACRDARSRFAAQPPLPSRRPLTTLMSSTKCDPDADGVVGQRARLGAVVQRPIVLDRRKAFRTLAASPHVSVREAALEAIAQHPELEDLGRTVLVQALGAPEAGVVASAAEAIAQHPERALTLARSERLAALDPRAPPPSTHPAIELPADVATALTRALGRSWREDAVETRTSLLDAAVAVNLPEAHGAAARACADPNVTMRQHAARALRALGAPQAACPRAATPTEPAATATSPAPLSHPVRVRFEIDTAELTIAFEPEPLLEPPAASWLWRARASTAASSCTAWSLATSLQFGDPGGDGYGGSGLRCETSPVAFGPLDVGVGSRAAIPARARSS